MNVNEITIFLLAISVLLFFARFFGELVRHFKQVVVIGEIIAGIILGPTLLGTFFPDLFGSLFNYSEKVNSALYGITLLGVIMLLLVSGLEIDLSLIIRQGKTALFISLGGIIFPFAVGFLSAYYFPNLLGIGDSSDLLLFSLFIGTALSITALPVVAKTLMDLKIFKTDLGFLIIASAMFDDLLGWVVFSIILAMIGQSEGHTVNFANLFFTISIFILFMLFIGRKLINYFIPLLKEYTSYPGGILSFIFIMGFLGAAYTEYIGIHAIFGAFIMGIAIGDSVHIKEEIRETIFQFVTNIFAPLFFVSIGLKVNFVAHFDLSIVFVFLFLAYFGKVVGCGLSAYIGGLDRNESLIIGFGMNSRGAMEIVLGTLAFQAGLIQEKVFVALVIMALVTSITSGPLMKYFLLKRKQKSNFEGLLKLSNILISRRNSKKEIIEELCVLISQNEGLDSNEVFKEVWLREAEMSTGIINGFAVPHARLPIQKPVIALAINKEGIEFDSMDKQLTHLIFLILIPQNEPEMQLKLIAEISKKFSSIDFTKELISLNDPEAIIKKLKEQK
jgi:Kef-type K+ transport system membrane component KefB